ncbi:MAG: hypothetical protein KGO49_07285 [Gammaproteobacteria bacterium]|nr:hypothetical protein [Gammaproteobacteria bacterium]
MINHQELSLDETFHSGLSITKLWCEARIDKDAPTKTLRPPELSPHNDIRDYNVGIFRKKEEIKRLNLIRTTLFENQELTLSDIHGKILVFYPELSLNDGLMCIASGGFIDENDCPPWATWFYYSLGTDDGSILYCWIPEAFIGIVNNAIDVDPYSCLRWL